MKLHDIEIDEQALAEFCRRNRIRTLSFFGSITRDDFGPDSDIDTIIEPLPPDNLSLFDLARLQEELTRMFGRQVHLHTPDMIHPYFRKRIHGQARQAYAA